MKNLQDIYEGILDDDFVTNKSVDNRVAMDLITTWIKENYYGGGAEKIKILKKLNKEGKRVVNITHRGTILVLRPEAESLTNDRFVWGRVDCDFIIQNNSNITNLQGCPEILGQKLDVLKCKNLTSLEGMPQEVFAFSCNDCPKLASLKGCSPNISEINLSNCNISSLEGLPKTCRVIDIKKCPNIRTLEGISKPTESLWCRECESLESLKGSPSKLLSFVCRNNPKLTSLKFAPSASRYFECKNCGRQFTYDEVLKISPELEQYQGDSIRGIHV